MSSAQLLFLLALGVSVMVIVGLAAWVMSFVVSNGRWYRRSGSRPRFPRETDL